jgi:hypothetical protein
MIEGFSMSKVEGRRRVEDIFWEIFEEARLEHRGGPDKPNAKEAIKKYLESYEGRETRRTIIQEMSERYNREKKQEEDKPTQEEEVGVRPEEEYMQIEILEPTGAMLHGPGESSPEEISVARSRFGQEYFFKVGPGGKVRFIGYSVGGSGRPEDILLDPNETLYSLVFDYRKFGEEVLKVKGVKSPESTTSS